MCWLTTTTMITIKRKQNSSSFFIHNRWATHGAPSDVNCHPHRWINTKGTQMLKVSSRCYWNRDCQPTKGLARTTSLWWCTTGSSPTTRRSSSSSPPRASSSSRTQTPRQWPSWSSTSTGRNFSNKKLQIDFYSQSPGSTFRQLVEQTISQLEVTIICPASTTSFFARWYDCW